ncbi:hypothetical protein A3J90_01830 [candidate division WOR-1 bacterium RIFOXYC2_FULL_37_10]|uniref:Antitoxin n=1 Tax=candidate division WOR-1 bacterium RIFOXYB2_FULL_37_13 TaxID=1802579 RepID=A0A1F4SNX3_UNCSA|nr:MAG: hypothetical protein A2310_04835 [candidate division WOR-1 bacterium RIFOXYB2_FULL_37_13]OGC35069.1 MAG: hypothetical protein A3J90_01830 [candidate division WOR-1 bacterium RIFOXYC2_FULL_37_10]
MKNNSDTLSVTKAREALPSLVQNITKLHSHYFITKRGRVDAVIMGIEEFNGWEETLDIISNKAELKTLRSALSDLRNGRVKSFKSVFGEDLQ